MRLNKKPIEMEHNGKQYRITAFVEIGGMSMTGDGSPEIDKLCRAQWLSPYGWKNLRNTNILAELRQICEAPGGGAPGQAANLTR